MSHKPAAILILGIISLALVMGTAAAQTSGDPLTAFTTTFFAGSGSCASCHTSLSDGAGVNVSFDETWRASMMANASKDPLWRAKVQSETLRTPSLAGSVEDKCATCHMPMAHTQAHADGSTVAIFGTGFLDPTNTLHDAAMDGVSCSLCHQIGAANLGDPSTFSGHFPIDTTTTKDRSIFGKYSDPSVNKMSGNFIAVHGSHIEDPANCATCHTLHTSAVDDSGTPIEGGENFPEQTPYQEWEHSIFGDGVAPDTTCQACHMPDISGTAQISKRGSSPPRSGWGKHYFTGGNSFILSILRDNGAALGVTASTANFNDAIVRTDALLGQETGTISIQSAKVYGIEINADLQVTNETGHKLPTGIPLRRTWIHMNLAEKGGQTLLESGRPLANGDISGNAADANQAQFEPHYELITAGDQVQIYEGIMGDDGDNVTYTLLRATEYLKDNRLLPLGFDKSTAPDDVEVAGSAEDDADFIGGADDVRYQTPISGEDGLVIISADLLYQTASSAFIKDLAQDSASGDYVADFMDYYGTADHTPDFVAGTAGVMQYNMLQAGWNRISAVIEPQNPDMDDIFEPILDDLVLLKNSVGQVYWPAYGIDDIGQWHVNEAYQVYMETSAYFSIFGTQVVPETTPIALPAGWTSIPYLRDTSMAPEQALASCAAELQLMKDNAGRVYWPGYGIDQIGEMQLGEGYQVFLSAPCTLTYPPND